jgi:hypothetical protein
MMIHARVAQLWLTPIYPTVLAFPFGTTNSTSVAAPFEDLHLSSTYLYPCKLLEENYLSMKVGKYLNFEILSNCPANLFHM